MSTPPPPRRRRIAGERRRPQDAVEETPADSTAVDAPPPPATPVAGPPAPPTPTPPTPAAPASADFPRWRLAAALVAAFALVTAALVLGLVTWDYREVQRQDRIEEVQDDAAAAAERAAAAVLSYKHDTLDADLQAAARFLSDTPLDGEPGFRSTYTELFTTNIRPLATETKATVEANVLASAVVSATEDRAQILVYVDQTTVSTANGGRPQVALNRTTFDMVKEDGSWLVSGIQSY